MSSGIAFTLDIINTLPEDREKLCRAVEKKGAKDATWRERDGWSCITFVRPIDGFDPVALMEWGFSTLSAAWSECGFGFDFVEAIHNVAALRRAV